MYAGRLVDTLLNAIWIEKVKCPKKGCVSLTASQSSRTTSFRSVNRATSKLTASVKPFSLSSYDSFKIHLVERARFLPLRGRQCCFILEISPGVSPTEKPLSKSSNRKAEAFKTFEFQSSSQRQC